MLRRSTITGLAIRSLEPIEIERAELLPFRDDDQRIGALGAVVGSVAIGHARCSICLRLLHAVRIVGAHFGAHVLQRA